MMKHTEVAVKIYLKRIGRSTLPGRDEFVTLGNFDKKATKEDSESLTYNLKKSARTNNIFLWLAVGALLITYLGLLFLAVFKYDDFSVMTISVPIIFVSAFGCIKWFHKIWLDKYFIDQSLSTLKNLPPNKAADFIQNLYLNIVVKGNKYKESDDQV